MAWSAPMTAVAGAVFSAAQFNQYVRDNLNSTAPALATTAGSHFATTGTNAIAERISTSDFITASETSSSTSYVNLSTTGPRVTVTTGTKAWVFPYCNMTNPTNPIWMSFDISGATTVAANDNTGIQLQAAGGQRIGAGLLVTGLTPGSNIFTAKYRVSTSGTGTWSDRRLAVMPL